MPGVRAGVSHRAPPRVRGLLRPAPRWNTTMTGSARASAGRRSPRDRATCGATWSLLPIEEEPRVGLYSGFTPLIRARRLGEALGVDEIYLKDDSVNHPTFSYKDRVVSVAISKAIEFGYETGIVRIHREPCQLGVGPRGQRRAQLLRLHSRGARGREDRRLRHLRPAHGGHQGDLRRREPPVQRDRRQVPVGLRQREPQALLLRGSQDPRLPRSPSSSAGSCRATSSWAPPAEPSFPSWARRSRSFGRLGWWTRTSGAASTRLRRRAAPPSSTP